MIDFLLDLFPLLGWITVLLVAIAVVAPRVSDSARRARDGAGRSLVWLAVPPLLNWAVLFLVRGRVVPVHALLVALELVLIWRIARRYGAWRPLAGAFAVTGLLWGGGILVGKVIQEPGRTIGDEIDPPYGGSIESVSAQFHAPALDPLYARVRQFASSGKLSALSCGDSVPDFRYRLVFTPDDGRYQERQVELAYRPALHDAHSKCLAAGMQFLFDSTLYDLDQAPLIDYGYHDSRWRPLGPEVRKPLRRPVCRCDLSRSEADSVERD